MFLLTINYRLIPRLHLQLPSWADDTVLLATVAVFLLIALIFFCFGLRRAKNKARFVSKSNELGEVQVSIATLENMVLRVVQRTKGIKDAGRKVSYSPEGLVVRIQAQVMPDEPLPGLVSDLQTRTKEYLEEITGLAVQEVKVVIDNVATEQAAAGR